MSFKLGLGVEGLLGVWLPDRLGLKKACPPKETINIFVVAGSCLSAGIPREDSNRARPFIE